MGYHQYGLSPAVDSGKKRQQLICRTGIQCSGRLIRKDQPGICYNGAGHSRSLLLSAGYFIRIFFQKIPDAQLLCRRIKLLFHLSVRHAFQNERQQNIILQIKRIQQVKVLKYESQIISPEFRNIFVLYSRQGFPVQIDIPFRGTVQSCHNINQRRFSGTALSHNRYILPFLHREIHAGQCLHLISSETGSVYFFQISHFQNSHVQ